MIKSRAGILVFFLIVACGFLAACGDSQADTKLINSSPLLQFGADVRRSVSHMVVEGVPVEKIRFNSPEQFNTLKDAKYGVFHSQGGGVKYWDSLQKSIKNEFSGAWVFNGELEVKGLDRSDIQGSSELIGYFIGLNQEECALINKSVGNVEKKFFINGIPRLKSDQSALYTKNMIDDGAKGYVLPIGKQPELNHRSLDGHPFGCFQSYDGDLYIYYHVLLER